MSQRIYFDESGYTGNNLLHPQQKFFSYASMATDEAEAMQYVEALIYKYGIQGGELKGSRLVRSNRGRKAIDEIIGHFGSRIKLSVSDKKFALACKLHEYIFEPCYSGINSIPCRTDFHRFMANILYVEFVARGAGAEDIFHEFEEVMRSKDLSRLDWIFSNSEHADNSSIICLIREFAQARVDDIQAELVSLMDSGGGKWILDLTNAALFTFLSCWGTEFDGLTAVCDYSRPLQDD